MKETLLVAGLGRCGTSLTMQILHAGGMPCCGDAPAFEPEQANIGMITDEFIESQAGKALKCLDPQLSPITTKKIKVIYLFRNHREQAKSTIKMARMFMGHDSFLPESRDQLRMMESNMRRDNKAALKVFQGVPVLRHRFEDILAKPFDFMARVVAFTGHKLDPLAAGVVVPRSPLCLPGFLELDLIEGMQ